MIGWRAILGGLGVSPMNSPERQAGTLTNP